MVRRVRPSEKSLLCDSGLCGRSDSSPLHGSNCGGTAVLAGAGKASTGDAKHGFVFKDWCFRSTSDHPGAYTL